MNDTNNIYYSCSKRVKFLKTDILKLVIDFFNKNNVTVAHVLDIYAYLQEKLNVVSVNKMNLRIFLRANQSDYVTYENILKINQLYVPEKVIDSAFSEQRLQRMKESLLIIGKENVIAILKTSGKTFFNTCNLLMGGHGNIISSEIFESCEHDLAEFLESLTELDLVNIFDEPDKFNKKYKCFLEEKNEKERFVKYISEVQSFILKIHQDNYELNLKYLLSNEMNEFFFSKSILRVKDFIRLKEQDISEIGQSDYAKEYYDILKKLNFSLAQSLRSGFSNAITFRKSGGELVNDWYKYFKILKKRVAGHTLISAGDEFGLTRERVRQIEKKFFDAFNKFYSGSGGNLSGLFRAFSKNEYIITSDEIKTIFGEYADILIYFLKQVDYDNMDYVPELDAFSYHGEINWYDEILKIADGMPQSMDLHQVEKYVQESVELFKEKDIILLPEHVRTILVADYKLNGLIYSRSKMPLTKKYDMVLRKYFPNGIYIYDSKDIARFRECYSKIFDDGESLPVNDRALYGRIVATTILCDKGKYISKPEKLISESLLKDICDYIDLSDKEIFMTNIIFYLFEDRLVSEGIKNKYHLQGVLHESVQNKYFFKRDYISKSRELTSMYGQITKFIKDNRIATKEQIRGEFPGVPDVVIALATQDDDIINGFSVFISKEIFDKNINEVETLKQLMQDMVSDGEIHASDNLLTVLNLLYPDVIEKFFIQSRYTLFSIIEALFKDEFSLSRPFFAKKGVEIGRQEERMRGFLEGKDEISVDDFMDFVRENSFTVWHILPQLNAFNDEYLLKNKNTLIRIDLSGVDKYTAGYVEDFINDLLNGDELVVLKDLNWSLLPKINIEWDEWLVYSIINKWSKKYKVMMTSNQLRYSDPVVYMLDENPKDVPELLNIIKEKRGFDDIEMMNYMRKKKIGF